MTVAIRPAKTSDIPAITRIYAHAVEHGTASFELDAPDAAPVVRGIWERGVQVSAPIARNRVRFSLGAWTTTDDVEAAIRALSQSLVAAG